MLEKLETVSVLKCSTEKRSWTPTAIDNYQKLSNSYFKICK